MVTISEATIKFSYAMMYNISIIIPLSKISHTKTNRLQELDSVLTRRDRDRVRISIADGRDVFKC